MSTTKVLLAFMVGAAAGVLTGILLAPDKGKKTRKKLMGKAAIITDSVKDSFNEFIDSLKGAYSSAKEEAEEMSEKAIAKINSLKAEARKAGP